MSGGGAPRRYHRTVIGCGAFLAVALVVLLPVAYGALLVPPAQRTEGPSTSVLSSLASWSNGAIRFTLESPAPNFQVSAVALPSDFVNQTVTGIAEINSADTIVSFASFSAANANWSLSPRLNLTATALVLSATVPVYGSAGAWESGDDSSSDNESMGAANVTVAFVLPGPSTPNPWTVGYSLNVTGWPWLNSSDTLGVEVRASLPSTSGHWVNGTGDSLNAVNRYSQATQASFSWEASAQTGYSGGGSGSSAVGSYQNITPGGADSVVRLQFGAVSGGYTDLAYDPSVGIVPVHGSPADLLPLILDPTSLGILAAGGVLAALLAAWARSRRAPPESEL